MQLLWDLALFFFALGSFRAVSSALDTLPQGRDRAGVQHVNLDVLRLCVLKGLAARLVGNLLREDNHCVRRTDACLEVRGIVQYALEFDATLLRCLDIVLLQSVYSANQCNAHIASKKGTWTVNH